MFLVDIMLQETDSWDLGTWYDADLGLWVEEDMVIQTRQSASNVRLGVGYTLVWREHFAIEPFVHLDLVVDGEEVRSAASAAITAETIDLSGSEFIGGVNFSLFF